MPDALRTGDAPSERRSLVIDAAWCGVVGLIVIVLRRRLGRLLGLPSLAVGAAGVATTVWAGGLAVASRTPDRRVVSAVAVANGVAATALVGAGLRQRNKAARWLLTAVAGEVAVIGATQVAALGAAADRPARA